jgi:hypothetical protein
MPRRGRASALPQEADLSGPSREVADGPRGDIGAYKVIRGHGNFTPSSGRLRRRGIDRFGHFGGCFGAMSRYWRSFKLTRDQVAS